MNERIIRIPESEMEQQRAFAGMIRDLPHRPKLYYIVTYGCQMNAHDTEKIAGMLSEMGMSPADDREKADLVIFNTCCIRDNAERKAIGNVVWLNEIKKNRPDMVIAVCGCMVQEPGMAEKISKTYPFVNLAFGTANLHRLPEMLYDVLNSGRTVIAVEEADLIAEGIPVRRLRKDFAYITIMYGCNNFCSYCIVPYVRGRERSRDMRQILREAEMLQQTGVQEIMLLGQNVNSYGQNNGEDCSFAGLLRELDRTGIPRIRFMTSHPKDLSDELIQVMADSKHILPQFHLPVQSGSDRILKKMNRHYTRAQYLDRVRMLRQAIPGIGLSTDIIVGFPGETEEDFRDTVSLMEEVRYDSAFTFVYSPRVGTKAAEMPDRVPEKLASARIQQIIGIQEGVQQETLRRFVDRQEEVLIEGISKRSSQEISGKGMHGVSITMPGKAEEIGSIIPCRVTGLKHNTLTAERIQL